MPHRWATNGVYCEGLHVDEAVRLVVGWVLAQRFFHQHLPAAHEYEFRADHIVLLSARHSLETPLCTMVFNCSSPHYMQVLHAMQSAASWAIHCKHR